MSLTRHTPTLVTLTRFVLGPIFVAANVYAWGVGIQLACVGLAILTDWLDGFLARRWKVVSTVGKLLDPFADALFCMMVFYICWKSPLAVMPGWVFAVLVAREAVVTFCLRPLALFRKVVIAASVLGKVKTVSQFVVIFAFVMLQMKAFEKSTFVRGVAGIGVYVVLVLSVCSALIYVRKTLKALGGSSGSGAAAEASDDAA